MSTDAPGPERVGPYRIIRQIARGGVATIYEATDPSTGGSVAVKVLRVVEGPDRTIERLQREAEMLAGLRHPNIVSVHTIDKTVDAEGCERHHYVMDYVEGRTLEEVAPELSRLDRLRVLLVVARAAGHAHDEGIVHRDLKPRNVLIDETRRQVPLPDRVRLSDFGLAMSLDVERLTRTGLTLGTPQYMAPEQVRGDHRRMGPWTDVWSLGIMLYELLVDRLPFKASSAIGVFDRIVRLEPRRPHRIDPTVPRSIEVVCLRALEKDPGRRQQTGNQFADELEQIVIELEADRGRPALGGWLAALARRFGRRLND